MAPDSEDDGDSVAYPEFKENRVMEDLSFCLGMLFSSGAL